MGETKPSVSAICWGSFRSAFTSVNSNTDTLLTGTHHCSVQLSQSCCKFIHHSFWRTVHMRSMLLRFPDCLQITPSSPKPQVILTFGKHQSFVSISLGLISGVYPPACPGSGSDSSPSGRCACYQCASKLLSRLIKITELNSFTCCPRSPEMCSVLQSTWQIGSLTVSFYNAFSG